MNYLVLLRKPVELVITYGYKYVVRHVTYIVRYKKIVFELNDTVKDLGFEKERINHQIEEAEKNLNNIEAKVTEWVQKVSEIETTVEVFKNDVGHERARLPNCYVLPYLRNRHRLSKEAKKMKVDVKMLIDDCPNVDEVAYRQNVISNDATLSDSSFVEFSSTKLTMEKVMRELEDSTVRMIGLYGPSGVGKSTLIKEIGKRAKDKLFNRVVNVDIKVNPSLQQIQEEIAYVLELRLEGEGENVRADFLRRRFKKERGSTLLILDGLWEKIDLNKLGIALDDDEDEVVVVDDDLRNQNKDLNRIVLKKQNDNKGLSHKVLKTEKIHGGPKGCKILLTSRDKKVLCDEMDIKSTFCVKELDDKDALMLFQKLAEIRNEMSDTKQEIVKKYCAGLPMAIVSVARALRNKSESVWEATLEKLKKQELVGVQTSMNISVKMSYDHLESGEIKSIFLLCAQMGHQPLITNLVKYCFGLGILEGVSSPWEARDRIKTSIQKLKDSGLLLDESSDNHLNMHDMVRDAALSIAHKDHNVFTLRNGKLDDWPDLERCTSISICNCDIVDGLPPVINCPQLKFFQIDTNDPSLKIPESFFGTMKNLKVLILTGFRLSILPFSIECLLKLRMLCLEQCTLDCNLTIIGKLSNLRILSFFGSQLKILPAGSQWLDKLQLLDISDCTELGIIPPNLISSLTCLEELYIRKSLIKYGGQDSFLSELKNLLKLQRVELSIPCVSDFPKHLFFDNLQDYNIVIGDLEMFSVEELGLPNKYEAFRLLALQQKDDTDIHSREGIKFLFKTVQSLLLGKVNGVQNVNELNIDGFPYLKDLSIIKNNDIKHVNSAELYDCGNIFPNLESLCLDNMKNLKMICYGPITVTSFAKLKTIKVEMCDQLKNLYSFDMVKFPTTEETCEISECDSDEDKFLASLEIIEVSECRSLKEIFQIPVDYGKVEFLKLHTLTLQSLPSFTCFYTKVGKSCWPRPTKAQTIDMGCGEIASEEDEQSNRSIPLFGEMVETPNLESLNLSSLNIQKIWSDQHLSSFCFQNLIKLVVKDCDKLRYLCSLSVASSLKKLKSLSISECEIMEKIFEAEGNSSDKVCVFPRLEEIHLRKMNSLIDMWETKVSMDSFSSLISLNIEECNKVEKIFPHHMGGWFKSLDNLKVSRCQSVQMIFEINDSQEKNTYVGINTNLQVILLEHLPKLKQLWSSDPDGILNFKKLRTIEVGSCNELRNLLPVIVAKDVLKLERMSALHCKKMVEIVTSEYALEVNNDPLVFPELVYVRLYGLSNIKHFCKGKHPIKCPKLKELTVGECMKLKSFSKEIGKTTNEEEKCVFLAEKVFPNLEYLEIDFKEAQNLLANYQMHCLKELSLISVQSVDLLYHFPYKMPNLEKLKLTFSFSHKELVPRADISQQRLGILLRLKELVLMYPGIKDLELGQVPNLQRLELLSLEGCHELKNIALPSVLTYLTCLKLKNCSRLKNLIASSIATSMVQLKTLKIINCREVEEIISNEGSKEGKVTKIVFSKLITIELVGLDNLTSFCSCMECEFEFSSLEILIIRECPKMEEFSKGESITPKLKDVFGVEGDEKTKWKWKDNLNATIQEIFNDKVTFTYSESLDLGFNNSTEFIIEQLWHATRSVHQNSFGYLKRLSAWGCDTLEHVIPSHLLSCFHKLEVLQVWDCSKAKVIFNINDENRVTKVSGIFRLKSLYLKNLPQLKDVWDKDPKGIIGLQVLKEINVSKCERLKSLFPASMAKDLTGLEVLEVTECEELEEIFIKDENGEEGEGTTQDSVFPRLTTLMLQQLPRLKYSIHPKEEVQFSESSRRYSQQELYLGSWLVPNSCFLRLRSLSVDGCHFLSEALLPCNVLPFLTNLETLDVRNCDSVKTIFDMTCATQYPITQYPMTFSMKNLKLYKLPNLENVWNKDPTEIISMHHLQEVFVDGCECLKSVFPSSVAKDIKELQNLVVKDCDTLMTIVAEDDTDSSGTNQNLHCPHIWSLRLRRLPNLKYFYYQYLQSDNFTHQVYFERCLILGENGVKMILSKVLQREKGLEVVLREEFPRNLLQNFKVLTLYNESNVFQYEILKQIHSIEKLVVSDGTFKKIFNFQSPNNVDYSGLSQLKVLHLKSLEDLICIVPENSLAETFLRNLETLHVSSCSSLINLVTCKVSFSNLTYLKVENCGGLTYLFTSSAAKNLGQLKRIEIKNCKSIEEIVSKEDGEESNDDEITFPHLSGMNLECLRNLRRFYKGSLSLSSLEQLSVITCPSMETLCLGTLKADKLSQVVFGISEVIPLMTDLNSTLRKAFVTKISEIPLLDLQSRPNLQEIWHASLQIPGLCFSKLKTLIVDNCKFLSDAVLPFPLLPYLPKLKTLKVRNCESVKVIFDVNGTTQDTTTFPLKILTLSKLPNLKNVWNEDLGILRMNHLREVHVEKCNVLTSVFSASVARDLELEKLAVKDCEGLITIVAEDNTNLKETNVEVTFPCPLVRSLELRGLPEFKYFYYCSLKADLYKHLESHTEDKTEKSLSLGEKGIEMILNGEFQTNFLHNLKVLTLCRMSDVSRYKILVHVPNTKKLVLCEGSFKEIFYCESSNNVDYSGLLLQLKVLHLESLPEHVFSVLENSSNEPFFRNLKTLQVISCSSLVNLALYRVSFCDLTYLKVEKCDSLTYLFTSSTAKNLGQLKILKIKNCKSIEEIVSKEGEEESHDDEITFPHLSCMNLEYLRNLRRFYKGSLSFTSLEKLSVINCHSMETLCPSPSTLKTEKLSQVMVGKSEAIPLKTDLNSTIRLAFRRKISELQRLVLKSRPGLQEIWHGSLHFPDFSKLAILIVDDCQFLSDAVLPFRLLHLLPKLETLEVRNCKSMKTIFDVKCATKDTSITFPLNKLILSKLPSLKNVWNQDPSGILSTPHLQKVFVDNCKCLKSIFPTSVAEHLVKLENLKVKDCERLNTIVEQEHDKDQEIIFERLKVLELQNLDDLTCFYPGNFTLRFRSLDEVHVIKCSSMKIFSEFNKIDHSIKWYAEGNAKPRQERDLNAAVRKTFEEKKRKLDGDDDVNDVHKHKRSKHESSKIDELGAVKVAG